MAHVSKTAADWSRALPRPLIIPGVMTLATLADVRFLIRKHLPAYFRDKTTWQHVAAELDKAAAGGDAVDVSVALRIALSLERGRMPPAAKQRPRRGLAGVLYARTHTARARALGGAGA
jgi:hypothetical protein